MTNQAVWVRTVVWAGAVAGLVLAIAGTPVLLREMARARTHVNYGSSVLILSKALYAVSKYEDEHKVPPFGRVNMSELLQDELGSKEAQWLSMWEPKTIPTQISQRAIVFVSRMPVGDPPRPLRYVGLRSGQVAVVAEKEAVLGSIATNIVRRVAR